MFASRLTLVYPKTVLSEPGWIVFSITQYLEVFPVELLLKYL